MQRDFLQDSDNAAKRYAVFMAMFVLISVTVGFNLLYDPEKHKGSNHSFVSNRADRIL